MSDWSNSTVLVTGGTGFLGSHIVRALMLRGDEVVVFDHRVRGKGLDDDVLRRLTVIEDDILHFDAVRGAAQGCSRIFHCAAMVGMGAYSKQPAKTDRLFALSTAYVTLQASYDISCGGGAGIVGTPAGSMVRGARPSTRLAYRPGRRTTNSTVCS